MTDRIKYFGESSREDITKHDYQKKVITFYFSYDIRASEPLRGELYEIVLNVIRDSDPKSVHSFTDSTVILCYDLTRSVESILDHFEKKMEGENEITYSLGHIAKQGGTIDYARYKINGEIDSFLSDYYKC